MKWLIGILVVLCCAAFSLQQGSASTSGDAVSCDNVLFQERLENDFYPLYLDEPAPYHGNSKICGGWFQQGELQCCSDLVFAAVARAWVNVRTRIALAVAGAQISVDLWRKLREQFKPVRNAVEDAYEKGEITKEVRDALMDFIKRVLAAWDDFVDNAIDNWRKCMNMVLRYWAGIICLGCDPNWEQYITEDAITHHIVLKLTPETCDDIRGGCLPVWQLVFNLVQRLREALAQLQSDLGQTPVTVNDAPICGGDCGAWLCDVFFSGKDAQTSLSSPDDSGATSKRNSDVLESVFGQLETEVTRLIHPHQNGPQFVEGFSNLLWSTHSAVKAFERVHRQGANTYANDYSNTNGYPATKVGEESSLDTSVDSASALSGWVHYLLKFVL
jgi:hypothetical protein